MMDFTYLPTRKKSYGGANGNKLCIIINERYKALFDDYQLLDEMHYLMIQ